MGELNSEAVKLEIFRLDLIKGNTRDLNICFYSPTHPREIDECKMMQVGRSCLSLSHTHIGDDRASASTTPTPTPATA